MSSDRLPSRRQILSSGLFAFGFMVLAGCTAQPLYGTPSGSDPNVAGVAAELAAIEISDPDDRVEQAVRNQLVFLTRRGGAGASTAKYNLVLKVRARSTGSASIQRPEFNADQPTAQRVELSGTYTLREVAAEDGDEAKEIVSGSRMAVASFDLPEQGYARLRAERDAEDRAARELAEQVYLALAQALARR